jgi:hypothetical protein
MKWDHPAHTGTLLEIGKRMFERLWNILAYGFLETTVKIASEKMVCLDHGLD